MFLWNYTRQSRNEIIILLYLLVNRIDQAQNWINENLSTNTEDEVLLNGLIVCDKVTNSVSLLRTYIPDLWRRKTCYDLKQLVLRQLSLNISCQLQPVSSYEYAFRCSRKTVFLSDIGKCYSFLFPLKNLYIFFKFIWNTFFVICENRGDLSNQLNEFNHINY